MMLAAFKVLTFATSITQAADPVTVLPSTGRGASGADPLPSRNDGAAKQAIVNFVMKVTKEGGPDFVPAPDGIAVGLEFLDDRVVAAPVGRPEHGDQLMRRDVGRTE